MTEAPILAHTGRTRVAGILGWPVAYSQSPRLHAYWLDKHGVDGAYLPLPVAPGNLAEAVRGLVALGFRGGNVTKPHKQEVMPLLDEITPTAMAIGAVNTLIVGDDGRITGTNSDAPGFLANLRATAPRWRTDRPAAVLGAGGGARAVCAALLEGGVPEVRLFNRTVETAQALADHFRAHHAAPIRALPFTQEAWRAEAAEAGVAVNTTSLGMIGQPPLVLNLDALPGDAVVADIVYSPLETPFLAAAAARGLACVDGLGMLLHQGGIGFEAWFGVRPEVDDALRAYVLEAIRA